MDNYGAQKSGKYIENEKFESLTNSILIKNIKDLQERI